jgi:hypothetical protein
VFAKGERLLQRSEGESSVFVLEKKKKVFYVYPCTCFVESPVCSTLCVLIKCVIEVVSRQAV